MSGYARFHRSIIGHPAFRNDAESMAFAYMVLRAAWQPVRVRYKGKAIDLKRGQLAMSVRDLADAMDRDKGWVERLLKRCKTEGMCETHAETGVMVITVCNYDKFQASADGDETVIKTRKKTPARQQQDIEQGMEEREEESPLGPPAGGRRGKTRLPEDWQLPVVSDLPPKARACAEQWTAASYETHGEAFVSFWRSNGRMMINWKATWASRIVALHSQVMRDQRFGNAPTGDAAPRRNLNVAEQATRLREQAASFRRIGREDDAADAERRAAMLLGQPPGSSPGRERGGPARPIAQLVRNLPKEAAA